MTRVPGVLLALALASVPACWPVDFDAETDLGEPPEFDLGDIDGDCASEPIVFSDTEFAAADWTVIAAIATGGATHEVEQDTTTGFGNPGPYRRMTHTVPSGGSIEVQHVYVGPSVGGESIDGFYDPQAMGAIDHVVVSMDRRLIDASPVDDAVLVVQGGTVYRAPEGVVTEFAWTTASATLVASDFDANGVHPDFSAQGAPIRFGYACASSRPGIDVHAIDNWSVTINGAICCTNATESLYVSDVAVGGDGTLLNPFGSVSDALARAAELDYCAAFVVVGEGSYGEDLAITRDTYITGTSAASVRITGTISNRTGSLVSIDAVTLTGADYAALDIAHPDASTILSGVVIEGAWGAGVRQVGGTLTVLNSAIDGTRRSPVSPLAPGIGLDLRDVEATIEDTSFSENDFQAIVLEGPAAAATLRNVTILETGLGVPVGPGPAPGGEVFDGYAALEVRGGAILVADGLDFFDNSNLGVYVHGGARADLAHLTVTGTRKTATGDIAFGTGLWVAGGTATVTDFDIGFSDLAGINLLRGALVPTLANGLVHDNVIGLAIDEMIDFDAIDYSTTRFLDNGINLDAPSLPVPDVGDIPLPG